MGRESEIRDGELAAGGGRMNWRALAAAFVCALVLTAPQGRAADYPNRPIRLIVPYAAGGPSDVQARIVGEYLGRVLKQSVVIDNRAGAQGAIGIEAAARSDPDGYTLLFSAASVFVLNPLLYKKLSYDPAKDFRVLAVVTDQPAILEINPSVPARTVAELVAYAKQNPGKLNFGSAGTGGSAHLAGEMFRQMAGIDMVHIPYKGMAPALTDLLSGNIQVLFDSLGTALPPIKAGLLRPLAVGSAQRLPQLPDLPTVAESGYPDYDTSTWYGIAAPSNLPDDILQKLKASLDRAMSDDVFRASLDKIGFMPLRPKSQPEIEKFVAADSARWARVIKTLNISLD